MRILYRVRQFWHTLSLKTDPHELEQARALLTGQQLKLFLKLQSNEQNHSSMMYFKLLDQNENQPDLLVAALLHDVGKLRYPMNPTERAGVVLAKALLPGQAHRWGQMPPHGWDGAPGWRKAFIVAEQHAGWGAEMARQAGVSRLTEYLIRKHHDPPYPESDQAENSLLYKLRLVDNES